MPLAPNESSQEDLNDYSIVVKVELGKTSFLLEGDGDPKNNSGNSQSGTSTAGKSTGSSSASATGSSGKGDVTTYEPAKGDRTVYWTSGGKSYNYSRDCRSLAKSKNVLEGPASSYPKTDPCNNCVR